MVEAARCWSSSWRRPNICRHMLVRVVLKRRHSPLRKGGQLPAPYNKRGITRLWNATCAGGGQAG